MIKSILLLFFGCYGFLSRLELRTINLFSLRIQPICVQFFSLQLSFIKTNMLFLYIWLIWLNAAFGIGRAVDYLLHFWLVDGADFLHFHLRIEWNERVSLRVFIRDRRILWIVFSCIIFSNNYLFGHPMRIFKRVWILSRLSFSCRIVINGILLLMNELGVQLTLVHWGDRCFIPINVFIL